MSKIHSYQMTFLSIGGFTINLVPFLLFMLLVHRNGDIITNILPFALFYAFRRTTLFMFRGNPNMNTFFGWFGLISASIGYFLGLFGQLHPLFWDLAAVGSGMAAACFPSVQKEFSLTEREEKAHEEGWSATLMWLLAILLLLGALMITIKVENMPSLAFLMMLFYCGIAFLGFLWSPERLSQVSRPQIRWPNVVLSVLLFTSVLLVRIGRSLGIGQPASLGIILLCVILLIILLDILIARPRHTAITAGLRGQLMVFGTCADFCAIFSAIYIGVTYGVSAFMWIIVAYAGGFLLAKPLVRWLQHAFPSVSPLNLNLMGITAGLLMTFFLQLYFIGIFLIRSFASTVNQEAIQTYHQANIESHDNVFMINYRLIAIAGLSTQLVLWLSLIGTMYLKGESLNGILAAFAFHHATGAFSLPVLVTHIVLVTLMIVFFILVNRLNHAEKPRSN